MRRIHLLQRRKTRLLHGVHHMQLLRQDLQIDLLIKLLIQISRLQLRGQLHGILVNLLQHLIVQVTRLQLLGQLVNLPPLHGLQHIIQISRLHIQLIEILQQRGQLVIRLINRLVM